MPASPSWRRRPRGWRPWRSGVHCRLLTAGSGLGVGWVGSGRWLGPGLLGSWGRSATTVRPAPVAGLWRGRRPAGSRVRPFTGTAQRTHGLGSVRTPARWLHDDDPPRERPSPPATRRQPGAGARGRRRAQPHRAALDGPALRGLGGAHRRQRPGRRALRQGLRPGRRRARHDAPRLRRARGAAPDARRRPQRAGALPHRQGRRRGPRRRAHRRRRRLRHQAVQPRGGRRPAARPDAAHHASRPTRAARCSSSATSRWTRTATRSPAPATRCT